GVPDDGEMSHRRERGLGGNPFRDADGRLARGSAGAVGDRDERRVQRLELADRLPEMAFALRRLRGEELERERSLAAGEQIADRGCARCRRTRGESLGRVEGHGTRLENPGFGAYRI